MNSIVKVEVKEVITVDWETLAKGVADLIAYYLMHELQEHIQNGIKTDDLGMLSMYTGDADDGFAVCEQLAKGNWEEVRNKLWSMDTAARETVYEYIERIGGEKFVEHYMD